MNLQARDQDLRQAQRSLLSRTFPRPRPPGARVVTARSGLDDFLEEDDFDDAVVRFVVDHEQELFFRKTLDWQSEHEFRITLTADLGSDAEYVLVPYGGAESIRAVIFGERFPTWQIPAAKWICEQRGVPLLQLQWLNGEPKLGPPVEWLLGDG